MHTKDSGLQIGPVLRPGMVCRSKQTTSSPQGEKAGETDLLLFFGASRKSLEPGPQSAQQ
jgi:hypothetical protein